MFRRLSPLALVVILAVGVVPLRASSVPQVRGAVAGIELCEQAVCGSAIFVGLFSGQVGINPFAFGTIVVAVNHDYPLPDPLTSAAVTGGAWQIKPIAGRKIGGVITGGSLYNNDDGTFGVIANMLVTSGGSGTLTFEGTLSHNTFPPTIGGRIRP